MPPLSIVKLDPPFTELSPQLKLQREALNTALQQHQLQESDIRIASLQQALAEHNEPLAKASRDANMQASITAAALAGPKEMAETAARQAQTEHYRVANDATAAGAEATRAGVAGDQALLPGRIAEQALRGELEKAQTEHFKAAERATQQTIDLNQQRFNNEVVQKSEDQRQQNMEIVRAALPTFLSSDFETRLGLINSYEELGKGAPGTQTIVRALRRVAYVVPQSADPKDAKKFEALVLDAALETGNPEDLPLLTNYYHQKAKAGELDPRVAAATGKTAENAAGMTTEVKASFARTQQVINTAKEIREAKLRVYEFLDTINAPEEDQQKVIKLVRRLDTTSLKELSKQVDELDMSSGAKTVLLQRLEAAAGRRVSADDKTLWANPQRPAAGEKPTEGKVYLTKDNTSVIYYNGEMLTKTEYAKAKSKEAANASASK